MRKNFYYCLALLCVFFNAINYSFAQKTDLQTARSAAQSFVAGYHQGQNLPEAKSVGDLVTTGSYNGLRTYYVFNIADGGFVIIAADQSVFPVLGYSFDQNYALGNGSPEFDWWMRQYDEQIAYCVSHELPAGPDARTAWDDLLAGRQIRSLEGKVSKSVAPLLHSTWDQGVYYNMLCPADPDGPGGHVLTGCVATCMAQTMYYYRYPAHGTGNYGYSSAYGYLWADFANTDYDWNSMQDNINNYYNSEMSKIQYHCGIAVDMMYAPDGSGAYMNDAVDAMINYFGYNPGGQLYSRSSYSDSQWKSMLRTNLDNKWPAIYSGHGSGGGHAFVCDGYDGTDHFHFNWGWSGIYDGYFYLDNLNPGYNFTSSQQAGLDIYPATQYPAQCTGTKTLTGVRGSIEDGSGPANDYLPNADCYWLIAPSEPTQSIILEFRDLATESGVDRITVYDGSTTQDPVLGVYSGNSLPALIQSSGDRMLIHFTSDNANNDAGWFASYKTVKYKYCDFMLELNEPAGSVSDGSDINNYNDNTICHWRIAPPGAHSFHLTFTSFDIEQNNDLVKIYDEPANLELAEFTGSALPPAMDIYSTSVLITFVTNSYNNAPGWDLTYTSSTSGNDELTANSGMLIYPNPASDNVFIRGNAEKQGLIHIELIDSQGRLVRESTVNPTASGNFSASLDVSDIVNGIYFIEMNGEAGVSHFKLFVK